jgi:glycerol-3-phosphate dehydrogenase
MLRLPVRVRRGSIGHSADAIKTTASEGDDMTETDVVVIGGGATGVGVARDLAMRGVDVVLCERGGLGAGTTGRSHGLLHSGARYATADPEGAAECIRESRVLRDIAGKAVERTDGLFVQLPDDDPAAFDARIEACRDVGIPTETLSTDAVRDIEPELTSDVTRAFRVPDGVIYPSRLLAATAESARQHGAEIRPNAPVTDIVVADGTVTAIETDDERIAADHVVNAGGAWAGRIAELAGVEVPMAPTTGVMVAVDVEGVDSVINRCRPPGDGDIVVPHEDRVVLGTTSTPVEDPDDFPTDEDAVVAMLMEGTAMVPSVAAADVVDVYWGVRPLYGGDDGGRGRDASRGFQVHDHDVAGLTTVTGGKLTTYRLMAEAVSDAVCERLSVSEPCRTADAELPAGDAEELDALVETFDAVGPADTDIVG